MRYSLYWFQFNWSAAYAMCIFKLRYNKNWPFLILSQNAKMPICNNPAYYSVKSLALNDVIVRGDVLNPPQEKSVLSKVDNVKAGKKN